MTANDLLLSKHDSIIELFTLDLNPIGINSFYYFHNQKTTQNYVFNAKTYQPLPIELEETEFTTTGNYPTPKLRVSNVFGLISGIVNAYGGLERCTITRIYTLAKYLGITYNASHLLKTPETYEIDRVSNENRLFIEYECRTLLDTQQRKIPNRIILREPCLWEFKDANCGFIGNTFNTCNKTLANCKERFGTNNPLPFGSFPGVDLNRI